MLNCLVYGGYFNLIITDFIDIIVFKLRMTIESDVIVVTLHKLGKLFPNA